MAKKASRPGGGSEQEESARAVQLCFQERAPRRPEWSQDEDMAAGS